MNTKPIKKITRKLLGNDVVIRTATTTDLGSMTSLLNELFNIEKDFTPDVRRQRQGLACLMGRNEATLLVAVARNKIVGMCTLQPLISTAEGGTVGLVEDLVVSQKWRSKGVGGMLLGVIETTAREQSMSRLQLLTDMENIEAMHFYDKHHWEKLHLIGMRKKFS